MWPALMCCRVCRCRYSLSPVCPICRGRAESEAERRAALRLLYLVAALTGFVIGLVGAALLLP